MPIEKDSRVHGLQKFRSRGYTLNWEAHGEIMNCSTALKIFSIPALLMFLPYGAWAGGCVSTTGGMACANCTSPAACVSVGCGWTGNSCKDQALGGRTIRDTGGGRNVGATQAVPQAKPQVAPGAATGKTKAGGCVSTTGGMACANCTSPAACVSVGCGWTGNSCQNQVAPGAATGKIKNE